VAEVKQPPGRKGAYDYDLALTREAYLSRRSSGGKRTGAAR
jgi:hypothetical protein